MNPVKPTNNREKLYKRKENWEAAEAVDNYWLSGANTCEFCEQPFGRHMIDGLVKGMGLRFALMCAPCHSFRGSGFGEGKGQLYTRLDDGRFIQTFGFTPVQLEMVENREKQ